jgi:ribosomal RNA assembly protein
MQTSILVPQERLKIIKKYADVISGKTNTHVSVGEDVAVEGDAVDCMTAGNVIKAVSRGFPIDEALELTDEEKTLFIITLPHKRNLDRIRARVIGSNGKAKKKIEVLTKCRLAVHGKTVSIIGNYDDIEKAITAVEELIAGSEHKNVYKSLRSDFPE